MALRALIAGVTGHDVEQEITSHCVGDATVIKVPELARDAVAADALHPDQANDPTAGVEEARKLWPGSVEPRTCLLRQSIHAWLVRTPTRVILVDTATGNDKDRPGMPILNHLHEPFLDRLKSAGAARKRWIWCCTPTCTPITSAGTPAK